MRRRMRRRRRGRKRMRMRRSKRSSKRRRRRRRRRRRMRRRIAQIMRKREENVQQNADGITPLHFARVFDTFRACTQLSTLSVKSKMVEKV